MGEHTLKPVSLAHSELARAFALKGIESLASAKQ
jgi:hypothetical protein